MGKRYQLSITALCDSTKNTHQTLFFQTRLLPQRISQEESMVHLSVCNGIILSCKIQERTGAILAQKEDAVNKLTLLGMLEWDSVFPPRSAEALEEQSLVSRQSDDRTRSATNQILVPKRIGSELPTDSRHRRVFILVDGIRSVQQIAKLLSKPSEEIQGILRALQQQGFITIFPLPEI